MGALDEFWVSNVGCRAWVWVSGLDLGFGVWSLGFRVWGLGFGVWDLGFGV